MIDASVFNTLKILNMIEKSVLPQLPNTSANQAMIPQVGTENFYKWMDIIMTQPNADPKSKARRRVQSQNLTLQAKAPARMLDRIVGNRFTTSFISV